MQSIDSGARGKGVSLPLVKRDQALRKIQKSWERGPVGHSQTATIPTHWTVIPGRGWCGLTVTDNLSHSVNNYGLFSPQITLRSRTGDLHPKRP